MSAQATAAREMPRVNGDILFDWTSLATSLWLVIGLFIDGWAHTHGAVDNTFFTPWHAIFYSGFAACGLNFVIVMARNMQRGKSWLDAIPVGYKLSALGLTLFAIGGIFDLIWHTLFGVEAEFAILLSPSHLLLGISMFLILGGPFRAAWQRKDETQTTLINALPRILSFTFMLALITFFTLSQHPVVNDYAAQNGRGNGIFEILGVTNILFQSGILVGFVLLFVRRWKMPFGGFTLVFALYTAGLTVISSRYPLILMAAAVGLLVDVFNTRYYPLTERPLMLRIFATLLPTIYTLFYFIALQLMYGNIWWPIHVWTGTIVESGIVGLLLSFVFLSPPALPTTASKQ